MMLAHHCSARASLAVLVAVLLTVLLLTAHRLHNGSSIIGLPTLTDAAGRKNAGAGAGAGAGADHKDAQRPPSTETSKAPPGSAAGSAGGDAGGGSTAFCDQSWSLLRSKDLDLSENVVYTRRCVKPAHGNANRDAVATVAGPLISGTTTLNLKADCAHLTPPPCEPLTLEVPPAFPPPEGQYSHLVFGIASSYERIQESLPSFAHWLAGTGAQLVAVVADADESPKPNLRALETLYRNHNVNATMIAPKQKESLPRINTKEDEKPRRPAAVEQLHFLLIRDMLDIATPQTQWLGVLDDDTFFPAMHPLDIALRQHDHTKQVWLGALADNWVSVKIWGFMAYGGAGTFLSMPLAQQLEPHLEACVRETDISSGDGMLRDCVYSRSTTKLTLVEGLYQHDFMGDASGFFESGRRALSLHHWKSWYKAPVPLMAAITDVCGDCFLQRWRFGKDTLLANGYSITVYREGLDSLLLDRMEGTFDEADGRFDFIYGPFRPRLGSDQKKSYRLEAVDGGTARGNHFRQLYVHRAKRDEEGTKPVDEVVELVWEV